MNSPSLSSSYKILRGIGDVTHLYDVFFLDIWGLLHDGVRPFPGVVECLQKLKLLKKKILLLSNSPRRSHLIAPHLDSLGIQPTLYDYLLTSGEATYVDLEAHYPGFKKCYFMGQNMHRSLLSDLSLSIVDTIDQADFIFNTGPENLSQTLSTYKEILEKALEKDKPMVCSNPDRVVMIGEQSVICAGTLAHDYQEMGGEVLYYGKPHELIYKIALSLLGGATDSSKILALGDSLHTDILGASKNGFSSALVFSGIHGSELKVPFGLVPLPKELSLLSQKYHITPDYYLSSFRW